MLPPSKLRRFANSLLVRLITFGVVLSLLAFIGRTIILTEVVQKSVQELVGAHLLSEANYVAADVDGKIRMRRQYLEQLAQDFPVALLDRPSQLEAWLAERHKLNSLFSLGLAVGSPDGRGAFADFPPLAGRRQLDFSASDWFRKASEGAKFAIGKPTLGRISQRGIIIMAVPILDANGRLRAVLHGTTALDAPGFLDLIQENPIGKTGGYLLISPHDGIFVAATMPKMRMRALPPPGVNAMHDRAMDGFRGTGIAVNAFGVEELVAIASVHEADWLLVARMPTDEAFQSVVAIRGFLARNSIVLMLILIVILVFYLRHMFRPMAQAARHMHDMADGKVPLAPLPVVRHDEVGAMVEGFNYLLAKLRESEARMTHLAHHDALTGLPNRLSFLVSIQQNAALARRRQGRLALMFIDLDGFKPVNDIHGHEAGDQLLQQVARRLGEAVRQSDTVARFGGDEFVALLTDVPDREHVGAIAEKIVARLSAPYRIGELDLVVGASIGIALFPDDADDIEALIAQADAAMYDAKHAGRGCHRFAHN